VIRSGVAGDRRQSARLDELVEARDAARDDLRQLARQVDDELVALAVLRLGSAVDLQLDGDVGMKAS